ncbi:hypothetical protein BJX68DRAFT_257432 [Aspergillus pseudodeflectus]|uniref:Zn(2)-C6 fungal-type domain-containing protein n=1 Tax=Aspergillus pseudodeflectus TaxID=176178 RepID=A0ABR4JUV6_9EURO
MATLRKNGQLPSCEPCRTSKLRCDHTTPVCQRCVARNRAERCVYHPCPLTKPRDTRQRKEQVRAKRNSSTTEPPSVNNTDRTELFDWVERAPSVLLRSSRPAHPPGDVLADSGFGSKASDDVSLSLDSRAQSLSDACAPQVDSKDVEIGAQILAFFEHLSLFAEVIDLRFDIFDGSVYSPHLMRQSLALLKSLYREALGGTGVNGRQSRLLAWSRAIFQNTARAIDTHPEMTLSEYVALITARWDTIGLVFALLGTATYQINQHDSVLKREGMPGKDKHGLRKIAMAASDMCIQFTQNLGAMSDPLFWATIQRTVFLFKMHGFAEVANLVFALGLHQGKVDERAPFFLSEMRARAMVCAYAMDKDISTILARPPRICSRYCNFRFPLDLDWADVVADAPVRDAAIQRLGPDGWDTQDHTGRECSRPRATLLSFILREMILEVSLSYTVDNLEEMLILSQAIAKLTGETPESLIATSRQILTVLLDAIARQLRTGHVNHLLICDFSYIGLPAAAALSKELLHRSHNPPLPGEVSPFPRSEIIQNLSVFAAHLEAFLPNRESDADTLRKGLQSVRTTLDAVLNQPTFFAPSNGTLMLPPADGTALPGQNISIADEGQGLDFTAFWEDFEFDWAGDRRVLFS